MLESVHRGAPVDRSVQSDKRVTQSNACGHKKLPPVTVSTSRPGDYRSAGAEVSTVLNWDAFRSGVDLDCLDIERIDQLVQQHVSLVTDATGSQNNTIQHDAGVAFPTKKH